MNYEQIRTQLQQRRQQLIGKLAQLKGDIGHRETPLNADSEEQALELENLDVLFELDEASRRELYQINNALERLDNHEYESCVVCGQRIGAARLRALPYTDTCIDCAR